MSRPQRWPRKLEFWASDEMGDAVDALEANTLLSRADHLRQALSLYLRALPPRPIQHDDKHHEVSNGVQL